MHNIMNYIFNRQQSDLIKSEKKYRILLDASYSVCQKWVSPSMYASAMNEIECAAKSDAL